MAQGKFWYCMVEGGLGFTHRHRTLEEARFEAVRLARKEKKRVYVLEAVSFCQPQIIEPPIEWETFWE